MVAQNTSSKNMAPPACRILKMTLKPTSKETIRRYSRKYFVPQASAPLAVWEAGHSSPERNRQLSEQFLIQFHVLLFLMYLKNSSSSSSGQPLTLQLISATIFHSMGPSPSICTVFFFFVFFSIVAWDLRKRIPFLSPGRRMRVIMIPAQSWYFPNGHVGNAINLSRSSFLSTRSFSDSFLATFQCCFSAADFS